MARRVLLDYKTGAATVDWRGERPDNPQLPVYALLSPDALVAVAYAKVNAAESGFVAESERREIFPRTRRSELEGMATFADLVQVWSRRIERIAGRVRRRPRAGGADHQGMPELQAAGPMPRAGGARRSG